MSKACLKSHISCSYFVGSWQINVFETIVTATILMQKIGMWRWKSVAFIDQKASPVTLQTFISLDGKNCLFSNKKIAAVHKGCWWFISTCIFSFSLSEQACMASWKASTGSANSSSLHSLSSISALIYSISLRAHLYAWFKHSQRGFLCPHSAQENSLSEKMWC